LSQRNIKLGKRIVLERLFPLKSVPVEIVLSFKRRLVPKRKTLKKINGMGKFFLGPKLGIGKIGMGPLKIFRGWKRILGES